MSSGGRGVTRDPRHRLEERQVEKYLCDKVKGLGGLCIKLSPDWYTGIPDRMCLLPGGRIVFIETKAPGKRERPSQRVFGARLRALGFHFFVCDTKASVDIILNVYA